MSKIPVVVKFTTLKYGDSEAKSISFIYGTPNEQSLPGYEKKANFKIIKSIYVNSMSFQVNISPIISRKTHWLLGNLIGYFYLILILSIHKFKKLINKTDLIEEIIGEKNVPENWDIFWNKAHKAHDFIFSRDSKASRALSVKSSSRSEIF